MYHVPVWTITFTNWKWSVNLSTVVSHPTLATRALLIQFQLSKFIQFQWSHFYISPESFPSVYLLHKILPSEDSLLADLHFFHVCQQSMLRIRLRDSRKLNKHWRSLSYIPNSLLSHFCGLYRNTAERALPFCFSPLFLLLVPLKSFPPILRMTSVIHNLDYCLLSSSNYK